MEFHWYISPVDGPYPWKTEGRWPASHDAIISLARTIDETPFVGALLGTYGHDVWTTASSLIPVTKKLRFLIPIYPGITSPRLLAQQALTFDDYSGGRLSLNLVNGTDTVLAQFGLHVEHDERYVLSAEYWDAFKKLYTGEPVQFDGKYFRVSRNRETEGPTSLPVPPRQSPYPPIYGAGASPAGIAHAVEAVDTYLGFLNRPDRMHEQFDTAHAAAAARGRKLRTGVALWIIVRETEEEALDHLRWLLEVTGTEWIKATIDIELKRLTGKSDQFATLVGKDPQLQRRIDALRADRIPDIDDLRVGPHLYTGPSPPSALDVVGTGRGTYLVGSPQQVADTFRELERTVGLDVFIMQGYPLEEEARRVAELVLPLMDLDEAPSRQLEALAS
jgi:alkanesulfonate monooxygenase